MSQHKITREVPYARPAITLTSFTGGAGSAPSGHVPTSIGSNGQVAWGSNVAIITANGSNQLLGPFVNFISGTNVTFAVASNSLTISAAGGGGSSSEVFYNVADYGAVGDGSTDDTTAITDTFDAADATGGGIIYFPPTTSYYKITSRISRTGTSKYHLLGGGSRYGPPRIHQATSNTGAFRFAPGSGTANRDKAPLIESLVITGAGGASSGRGIEFANDGHVRDCFVSGFYDGIYWGTASYYSLISDSTVSDCDHAALRMVDTNNITVRDCRLTGAWGANSGLFDALGYGIYIESASPAGYAMRIIGGSVEYFTQDGIYVDGGGSIDIIGTWFESSQSSSGHAYINLGPGSNSVRGVLIAGCHFEGPGVSGFQGIKTDRASYVTIEANEDTTGFGALTVLVSSTANGSRFLQLNNAWGSGTVTLPTNSYTLDPASPPLTSGDAAGGDLGGTYPNPTVTDDSHSHTAATLPASSGGELLISDSPSTPLIFADLLQNEAQTDLIYSD